MRGDTQTQTQVINQSALVVAVLMLRISGGCHLIQDVKLVLNQPWQTQDEVFIDYQGLTAGHGKLKLLCTPTRVRKHASAENAASAFGCPRGNNFQSTVKACADSCH